LRGSGRFKWQPALKPKSAPSLNPLHCGAVVASGRAPSCAAWRRARLNPLHCGAVVASIAPGHRPDTAPLVSIPFIAGQWSLPPETSASWLYFLESQSPSLRGSGRFFRLLPRPCFGFPVSQSPSLRGSGRFRGLRGRLPRHRVVSIPFIAGQWSLPARVEAEERARQVSIPFIAGQWSLRKPRSARSVRQSTSQSPSLRGSGRFKGPG